MRARADAAARLRGRDGPNDGGGPSKHGLAGRKAYRGVALSFERTVPNAGRNEQSRSRSRGEIARRTRRYGPPAHLQRPAVAVVRRAVAAARVQGGRGGSAEARREDPRRANRRRGRFIKKKRGQRLARPVPTRARARRSYVPDPERIAEIDAMRKRLRADSRGVIDPNSKFMKRWDIITTVALLFTAIVTPVEVGFSACTTSSAARAGSFSFVTVATGLSSGGSVSGGDVQRNRRLPQVQVGALLAQPGRGRRLRHRHLRELFAGAGRPLARRGMRGGRAQGAFERLTRVPTRLVGTFSAAARPPSKPSATFGVRAMAKRARSRRSTLRRRFRGQNLRGPREET